MSVQQSRVQGFCNGIRIYRSYIKPYLSAIELASRKNCTNSQNIAEESQRSVQSATGLPQHKIQEIGLSPAQIFFGRKLRTLLPTTAPLLNAHNRQDIRRKLKEMQQKQKHYYDQHSKPVEPLENEQKVLIHNGEKCAK
jgi:hypothetical protein